MIDYYSRDESELEPSLANEVDIVCEVCSGKSKCHNLGANVCRACARFFKRSVIENLKYVCVGRQKCNLKSQKSRTVCKACRFTQCVNAGAVVAQKTLIHNFNRGIHFVTKTLKNVFEEYIENERKIFLTENDQMIYLDYAKIEQQGTNVQKLWVPRNPGHLPLMLNKAFPSFQDLDLTKKKTLVAHAYAEIIMYLQCYLTIKHYSTLNDDRFMISYGYTVDVNDFDHSWYLAGTKSRTPELLEYLHTAKPIFDRMKQGFSTFRKLLLTEHDLIYCFMLSLFRHAEELGMLTDYMKGYKERILSEWVSNVQKLFGDDTRKHIADVLMFYATVDEIMLQCRELFYSLIILNKIPKEVELPDLDKMFEGLNLD